MADDYEAPKGFLPPVGSVGTLTPLRSLCCCALAVAVAQPFRTSGPALRAGTGPLEGVAVHAPFTTAAQVQRGAGAWKIRGERRGFR
jgi:hypothetical protein